MRFGGGFGRPGRPGFILPGYPVAAVPAAVYGHGIAARGSGAIADPRIGFNPGAIPGADRYSYAPASPPVAETPEAPLSDRAMEWLEAARATVDLLQISDEAKATLKATVTGGTAAQWGAALAGYLSSLDASIKRVDVTQVKDFSDEIRRIQQTQIAVLFAAEVMEGRSFPYDGDAVSVALARADEMVGALIDVMKSGALMKERQASGLWADWLRGFEALTRSREPVRLIGEGLGNHVAAGIQGAVDAALANPVPALAVGGGFALLALLALALLSRR